MKSLKLDQQKLAPWLFISPFFILFIIFGIFPIGFNMILSFQKWRGMGDPVFIGLDNYQHLLFKDPLFWKALGTTGWLLVFGSLTQHIIAVPVAILLNNKMLKGRNFFKTMYFLPYITSTVSVTLVFQIIYANEGLFNHILAFFTGEFTRVDWTQGSAQLPLSVAILVNWKYIGWNTVIYLAGLQSIPAELYEAADIDGAPTLMKHTAITIPQLMPIIFFGLTISIIGGMNLFIEPYVLTRGYEQMGGTDSAAMTIAFYIMWLFQRGGNPGRGAAVSWLLFIIVVGMTYINKTITDIVEGNRPVKANKPKKIAA